METLHTAIISVPTSLPDSLRTEWEDLWRNSPSANMFNSPGWFAAASRAFTYEDKIVILIRESFNNNLVAVVPLVKTRIYGLSVFALPGSEFVDRFSFLADLTIVAVAREIVKALSEIGTVYITGLTGEDVRLISEKNKHIGFFAIDKNPYLNFERGKDINLPSSEKSKSMQRAKRSFGQIGFSLVKKNHKEALYTAFKIDQQSSKNEKGKGIFWRDDAKQFFIALAEENPDCLFVELLSFAEKPVSYSIGFVNRGIYACSQKAHLSEYGHYRPGGLAFLKFLEMIAFEEPREVDFGKGYDQFKMDFTKTFRLLYGLVVSKSHTKRLFFLIAHKTREKIYQIFNHSQLYKFYKNLKKKQLQKS